MRKDPLSTREDPRNGSAVQPVLTGWPQEKPAPQGVPPVSGQLWVRCDPSDYRVIIKRDKMRGCVREPQVISPWISLHAF